MEWGEVNGSRSDVDEEADLAQASACVQEASSSVLLRHRSVAIAFFGYWSPLAVMLYPLAHMATIVGSDFRRQA